MTALGRYFRNQANWRRSKAAAYPDDSRNAQSAQALESLADYIDSVEGTGHSPSVDALADQLSDGVSLGGQETQRAVTGYGFGYDATSSMQHEEFVDGLLVKCAEDSYELVREIGGSQTSDILFPFEVDAARRGVRLPPRYFELRAGSTEEELKRAIAEYATH